MGARTVFLRLAAIGLVGALAACSNGRGSVSEQATAPPSGGSPPPQPPPEPPPTDPPPQPQPPPPPAPPPEPSAALAGYWKGEVAERSSRSPGLAFIDTDGRTHVVVLRGDADDFLVHGAVCCEAKVEAKFGGERYLKTDDDSAEISAELAGGRLVGQLDFRKRDYDFNFARDAAWSQALTMQDLTGVYTRITTQLLAQQTLTVTIDANGRLTGSHSNGCVFNGSASIPDATRNMVRFDVEIGGCGSQFSSSPKWNGAYTGLGVLLRDAPVPGDGARREDALQFSLVGPTWFGLLSVGK